MLSSHENLPKSQWAASNFVVLKELIWTLKNNYEKIELGHANYKWIRWFSSLQKYLLLKISINKKNEETRSNKMSLETNDHCSMTKVRNERWRIWSII